MITATNIHKSYGALKVLKGIELSIDKAEIISVVGASGAGKSTLLHILGSLDNPDSGSVYINDTNISKLNDKKLSAFRNKHIGFVFQFHHLLPEFTALENICIPAFIAGLQKKAATEKAMKLAEFLRFSERLHHKPSELSGGEQQRVAVARALINDPFVIFADEPSGNLDSNNAKELHKLFFDLRDQFEQTFVIVTHNQELANLADRKLTIVDGIIMNGS
jgi:lipoprotein-releasing system ATP-binding protein